MNAEELVFEWLDLSVLIRKNSMDSWIKSEQRGSEVQVHSGLSHVPTIQPGLRASIKFTGREFRRVRRGLRRAFERPADCGRKDSASSDRGAESVRLGDVVSIRALRGTQRLHRWNCETNDRPSIWKSYPVRVGDDGKRVAGETGC